MSNKIIAFINTDDAKMAIIFAIFAIWKKFINNIELKSFIDINNHVVESIYNNIIILNNSLDEIAAANNANNAYNAFIRNMPVKQTNDDFFDTNNINASFDVNGAKNAFILFATKNVKTAVGNAAAAASAAAFFSGIANVNDINVANAIVSAAKSSSTAVANVFFVSETATFFEKKAIMILSTKDAITNITENAKASILFFISVYLYLV